MVKTIIVLLSLGFSRIISAETLEEKVEKKKEDKEIQISRENQEKEIQLASKSMFGADARNKFTLYEPSYFVFGSENLKMQFSGKYRVAKSFNLYLGYTQTMFWNIYDPSAPFDDINYKPEAFYRLVEDDSNFIRSIDFGMQHNSNGKDDDTSRSLNNLFLKTNFTTKLSRHNIIGEIKARYIYSKSSANDDIIDYMGYWEAKFIFTHILVSGASRLDLELRTFAGKSVINFAKGGRELGLVYHTGSENFNPAFYVQYYSGYAESLLHYNQKSNQVRGGLLLFF